MSAVRVGVVGLGRLSEVGYLPALRSLDSAELVAVADVREARCARLAPGVRAYPDTTAMVAGADVELVVVATPPSAHLEVAIAAADAGVATLVEKPPAETLEDAAALAALDPRPWLGLNRRFDPGVDRLRQRVAGFRLPLDVSLEMSILPGEWGSVTAAPEPRLDLGAHLADLAVWVTGRECVAVRAHRIDEAVARFEIQLDGGRVLVTGSHASGWHESVLVNDAAGARARLTRGGRARRIALTLSSGRRSPLVATLAAQLAAACAAVRAGAADERLATADHGVVVMGILDAAALSARREGAWVEVAAKRVAACSR
ncbi:MAG: putative dehydrogenase [Thermoleophilia bacterium]|nr:putative dehydrogenase [Thermoleophilia bacterium]